MEQNLSLDEHLSACANLWSGHVELPLARLGKLVVNDTAFFNSEPKRGPTTATLEKFAAFLGDPGNWPDGIVPDEVCNFVHRVQGCRPAGCLATGKSSELSGGVVR